MEVNMKKIFLGLMILMFFLSSWPREVMAKSYPMKLRGGGDMIVRLISNEKGEGGITIIFKRAKNHNNLQPGEAAWLDRAIKPDEPNRLVLFGKVSIQLNLYRGKMGEIVGPEDFKNLWEALRDGKEFIVYCKKNYYEYRFYITQVGL